MVLPSMGVVLLGLAWQSVQLVPDGTLLFHILLIVVMVALLNRTLFKPIYRILNERELQTRGLRENARATIGSVERNLAEYELALKSARAHGYQLLEAERGEAVRDRDNQLAMVREDLAKVTADEKEKITQQLENARKTLEADARQLGLEIGSRILGRRLSE